MSAGRFLLRVRAVTAGDSKTPGQNELSRTAFLPALRQPGISGDTAAAKSSHHFGATGTAFSSGVASNANQPGIPAPLRPGGMGLCGII